MAFGNSFNGGNLGGAVDLTAPTTNIGTVTPPAIIVSTLFRSANTGNIPFVAQSSGTGAFQLQPTDSTVVGGNARGANAVDLQTVRSAATEVASALGSVTIGKNNTASASNAVAIGVGNTVSVIGTIALGRANTASANDAMAIGVGNTVSGIGSVALGNANTVPGVISFAVGNSNIASGSNSVAMGLQNTASGDYSVALGNFSTTKSISSYLVLGSRAFSSAIGKNQLGFLSLAGETINATPKVLNSDPNVAATANQLALQNNSATVVRGLAIATITGAGDTKSWEVVATIKRGANAASTVLVGSPTVTVLHQDAGASTWVLAITADTTNGCLAATVTNDARTVRVNFSLFNSEVAF